MNAALELINTQLPNADFDPEGDMFVAVSPAIASLKRIAEVIRELTTNPESLERAVEYAKQQRLPEH